MSTTVMPMPQYQSQKVVGALKIANIMYPEPLRGAAIITFEDENFPSQQVNMESKPKPEAGWYYIRYADGYVSFSPAQQFEEGYGPLKHDYNVGTALMSQEPIEASKLVIPDLRSFKQEEIDNWFTYHTPTAAQQVAYRDIRAAAKIYAETVNKHVPPSADKTAAMRNIRESVMAANLAIACN